MDWLHRKSFFIGLASLVDVILKGVPPLNLESSIKDGIKYIKAFGGLLQGGVPSGYTAVEYVERPAGNTEQYVETNWKPNLAKNIRIQGKATYMGTDTNYRPLLLANYTGTRSSTLNIEFDGRTDKNLRIYTLKANANTGNDLQVGPFATNDVVDFDIQITGSNGALAVSATVGGTTITGSGTIENVGEQTLYNMMLFKDHRATTTGASKVSSRIHYLKATEGDKVVFELIPAVRNSDNAVGFYDKVSGQFLTNQGTGSLTAGNAITPTPSDPVDLVCNNGALKILDKSDWTIFTNPTSVPGQGVFISSAGKWTTIDDSSAGVAIPLTIGKQYTLVIHKKTIGLGTTLRFGQSPQATPTAAGVQLIDWYRGTIADGQMVSFVAKQPYLVMQLARAFIEAGGVDEAIEVLEAQGAGYTFVDSITASGTQYIDTGILAGSDIKAEVKYKPTSFTANPYCALGGRDAATGTSRNAFCIWANVGGRTRFDYQTDSVSTSASSTTNWNIAIKDGVKNYLNGVAADDSTASTFTSSYNIYLFAAMTGATGAIGQMVGSIAYCKIWKAGVLVRDFMPAIRNSDNVVGMYDTVSGTFFENQGTGTFVAGPVIGDGEVLKLTPSNDTAGVANLFKIGNYVDTQEILTGLINHQLGIYVFDGTEDWKVYGTPNPYFRAEFGTGVTKSTSTEGGMSTHFAVVSIGASTTNQGMSMWVYNDKDTVGIRYNDLYPATSANLASFKSWLAAQYAAGTPVMMVFPLLTAQDEVAPVPQTMQTVAGDNECNIVQSGMTGLEIEVKYTKG